MLVYPPSLLDALALEVETDAGEDWFEKMMLYNQALSQWLKGKMDTGTFLEITEYCIEEDPFEAINPVLGLYIPGAELL